MFDSNEAMKSARAAHESLQSWVELLLSMLNALGTNREKASMEMASLLEKMGSISNAFPPPIVSLALTFVWNFSMNGAAGTFKDHNDLVLKSRQAVTSLGQSLGEILKEEGWTKEAVMQKTSPLAEKLIAIAADADSLIFILTIAVALDNYAKFLVRETLLPRNP